MSIAAPRPFSGRQFLAILLGAFALVATVNGTMIWLALSSWSGLVSDSAYEDGLGFDRVLAQSKAEAALGWKADISYDARSGLSVALVDDHGQSLGGMQLSAAFLRPTSEGFDRKATLAETGFGHYASMVHLPLPGVWDVRVTVKSAGQARFHAEQRIVVGQ